MQIFKNQYPGATSKAAIEALIKEYEKNKYEIAQGGQIRKPFPSWVKQAAGEGFTYISKTKEQFDKEEAEKAKSKAESESESEQAKMLVRAKSDSKIKDQVIEQHMNKAGFTSDRIAIEVAREWKGKDISQFKADNLAAYQKIVDRIAAAK
jgi:hypothetical protein